MGWLTSGGGLGSRQHPLHVVTLLRAWRADRVSRSDRVWGTGAQQAVGMAE